MDKNLHHRLQPPWFFFDRFASKFFVLQKFRIRKGTLQPILTILRRDRFSFSWLFRSLFRRHLISSYTQGSFSASLRRSSSAWFLSLRFFRYFRLEPPILLKDDSKRYVRNPKIVRKVRGVIIDFQCMVITSGTFFYFYEIVELSLTKNSNNSCDIKYIVRCFHLRF